MGNVVQWSVLHEPNPDLRGVEPDRIGIEIPESVLKWAASHGPGGFASDSDSYLVVCPSDEANSFDLGVTYYTTEVSPEDMATIRAALTD